MLSKIRNTSNDVFFFLLLKVTFTEHNNIYIMKRIIVLALSLFVGVLTAQEFPTGLEFSEEKYNEIPKSAPILTRSFTSLPSKYSLKAYSPTPKSQGRQPSCVGWASGYGARTISYAIKKNWKNNKVKINSNTFSPSFVYNQIKFKGDVNCKRGSYIADAMRLIKTYGILKFSQFSYDQSNCTKKPNSYGLSNAKVNTIEGYERLSKWGDQSRTFIRKIKKAISSKNPVVIGMKIHKSFYRAKGVWRPTGPTDQSLGGHAMVVVGYDDNKYGGAFEILNSWGTAWGNGGYIWVPYDTFKRQTNSTFVMVENASTPNITNDKKVINKISGEIKLTLSDGYNMYPSLSDKATRNFNIVKATKGEKIKATYEIKKAYPSGTQFRIYMKSAQRGYVYLIGYGGYDKSVNQLYPFDNYSPFFNYTNSEIAIPNEDYFIEFDNKPGQDILCVLYSKERLNINDIINKAKTGSGDFVANVKSAFRYKMFNGKNIQFENNRIAFKASSSLNSAKVVPIFISVNHTK